MSANSFQIYKFFVYYDKLRIEKFSLLNHILREELPMNKDFDWDFLKRIGLKLNSQILSFI